MFEELAGRLARASESPWQATGKKELSGWKMAVVRACRQFLPRQNIEAHLEMPSLLSLPYSTLIG